MNITPFKMRRKKKKTKQLPNLDKELLKKKKELIKAKKDKKKKKKILRSKLNKESEFKKKSTARDRKIQKKLKIEKERIQVFSHNITNWFSQEAINKIAHYTGYIKRKDLKIQPLPFMLVLAYTFFANGEATLTMLAASMLDWFNICITPQALSDRMSKIESVKFLKRILTIAMTQQIKNGFQNNYAKLFSQFTSVKIEDSTQFILHERVKGLKGSGGSASNSAMKLNTVYNITEHTLSHHDIVSGSTPDQALSKNVRKLIKKGDLWIRDLGYFNIADMFIINKLKSFFISRLKKGVRIFFNKNDDKPILILDLLEKLTKNNDSFDIEVYIGEGDERFKIRLLGEKVPMHVQQKRIENYKNKVIKRDKKKSMKSDYFTWFGYSIFITNVDRSVLSSALIVLNIYRIRWQIEIFFKRIKSLLRIDIIKGESQNRVLCLVYAKLISLLMSQSIMSYASSICVVEEESEYKVMQWLKENNRLSNAIINGEVEDLLIKLIQSMYLLAKNKRKRKSTFRLIQEAFEKEFEGFIQCEEIA